MQKRGRLPSDIAFTDEIIRQAEMMKDPFFFFAVTLQGHGPYEPNRYPDATHKVDARVSPWSRASIASYAEGASDADQGLKRLIDWASKRQRKTIIAFFGDHLPPLGPVYVETGFMKEPVASRRAPAAEMAVEHQTPLIIWSNRSGPVKDLGGISPAFIPLQVLRSGRHQAPLLHRLPRQGSRPVPRGRPQHADRRRRQGLSRLVAQEERSTRSIRDFRFLQYDMMFDKRQSQWMFFPEEGAVVSQSAS